MSSRNATSLGLTRERIIILLVAISVPLIVQFLIKGIGERAGATMITGGR